MDEIKLNISSKALKKSGRVIYAFSEFYLPFYGLKNDDIFWHFDPYACISAYIYEIDEGVEVGTSIQTTTKKINKLKEYLNSRVAIDTEISSLLVDSIKYYKFEKSLINKIVKYSLTDLINITSIRSFDFRLMHRVLSQLFFKKYREELFNWFKYFEILMEIEDDMNSIEVDRNKNTFNIVVLAQKLQGSSGMKFIMDTRKNIEEEALKKVKLLTKSDQKLCKNVLDTYRKIVPEPKFNISK